MVARLVVVQEVVIEVATMEVEMMARVAEATEVYWVAAQQVVARVAVAQEVVLEVETTEMEMMVRAEAAKAPVMKVATRVEAATVVVTKAGVATGAAMAAVTVAAPVATMEGALWAAPRAAVV